MFDRNDNLKQAISLLGVMLALSSSAQHTRLFCHLVGCVPSSRFDQCCKQESSSADQCLHSQPCQTVQVSIVEESQNGLVQEEDGSYPCPSSCWCHQSPAPMELPKSTSGMSVLVLLESENLDAVSIETIADNLPLQVVSTVALESSALSAPQRCVQLCRFLT